MKEAESQLSVTHLSPLTTHRSSAHDVAAAYRLAKAEVRVQLPLGAFGKAISRQHSAVSQSHPLWLTAEG